MPTIATLDPPALGARLRVARKQVGWTLAQLAHHSGVSITTISRAERGLLVLGYKNLAALGRALRLDLGSMLATDDRRGNSFARAVLTRAGEGTSYRGLSVSYEFLAGGVRGKQLTPVLGTVHARSIEGPEDFARHLGEEFVYVLSGEIEIHFETGDVVDLGAGDSLYFNSQVGHAYISVSRQLARTLAVMTTESQLMRSAREGEQVVARAAKRNRTLQSLLQDRPAKVEDPAERSKKRPKPANHRRIGREK